MAKQVTDRQGAVNMVASAAETHADRIQEKFQELFSDVLDKKEKMPDMRLVSLLCARKLRRVNVALVSASDAHDRELADDAGPREARDAAAATLTKEVVEIRGALEIAFGAGILTELGLDGK